MAGFGGSVKLTGETEYKKALKSIQQGLKEVSSEMKLASAQYASNDKNIAALSARSSDMAKKINEQKKALDGLKTIYSNMASQYDAQTKKVAQLQKSYDAEKAKLDQIKSTLGVTSSAYKEQASAVDKLEQELKQSVKEEQNMAASLSNMRTQINNTETAITKSQNALDKFNKELDETPEEAKDASKGVDDLGESVDNAGKKFSGFSKVANTALKGLGVALAAAGAGAVAIGKAAIQNYADYEQLVGGIETLFGTNGRSLEEYAKSVGLSVDQAKGKYKQLEQAQNIVTKNSANAFKTAGMSANDYMETVTSFSASLISSLDGDTVKAAKAADMAITDMSDNANKMGTDIQSIQNAYQGFAKQNYVMLDNLKLGYGGTKEEMQRLLKDAEKLSGVKYDISNLNDVYEAIHVVQTEMGITGTTAKEASETISGSTASMRAAWQNLLTGIADDNADFNGLVNNFVESVVTVSKNLIPRIKTVIGGISELVNGLVKETLPMILKEIPPLLSELLPSLITTVESVIDGIAGILPDIITMLTNLLPQIIKALTDMIPRLIPVVLQVIGALLTGISEMLPNIVTAITTLIPQIVTALVNGLPQVIQGAITLFRGIIQAIPQLIMELIPQIPQIVKTIISTLLSNLPNLISGAFQLFMGLATGLGQAAVELFASLPSIVMGVVEGLAEPILNLFNGLWDNVKNIFGNASQWLYNTIIAPIVDFMSNLWNNVVNGAKAAWQGITSVFSVVTDWFKNVFSKAWQAVKNVFSTGGKIFNGIKEGIVAAFKAVVNAIIGGINKVVAIPFNAINGVLNRLKGINILGVSPFGWIGTLPVPQIPYLREGGVLKKGQVGFLEGDGDEAVVPLEKNTKWITQVAKELSNSLGSPIDNLAGAISSIQPQQEQISDTMFNDLVNAFKEALKEVKIVLDDDELGAFVEKTVADAIYT